MGVLGAVRRHAGVTAVGVAVLLAGGGAATAALVVSPASDSDQVFEAPDGEPAPTTTAEVVEEPVATPADEPATEPVTEADTATVEVVPQPENTPAPPASQTAAMSVPPGVTPIDPADPARGGHNDDGDYVPAVPVPKEGEPTAGPDWGTSGTTAEPGPDGTDLD